MVYKNTVALVADIKRNVLVGLVGAGAAVLIPDCHTLSVLGESGKSFAETVNQFSYAHGKLLAHVGFGAVSFVVRIALPVRLHAG